MSRSMLRIPLSAIMIALLWSFYAPAGLAAAQVTRNTVVIFNGGSTNTIGYRIYLSEDGGADYVDGHGQGHGKISLRLVERFLTDLKRAEPLSSLPVKKQCIKPASKVTSVAIRLAGEQSPDLTCAGNRNARSLLRDVQEIVKELHVTNVPKCEGKELPAEIY